MGKAFRFLLVLAGTVVAFFFRYDRHSVGTAVFNGLIGLAGARQLGQGRSEVLESLRFYRWSNLVVGPDQSSGWKVPSTC